MPVVVGLPMAEVIRTMEAIPLLLSMSLVTSLLPTLIYVYAAPELGPTMSAVCGGFEVPVMMAFGVLAFGEVLAGRQVLATTLVVMAFLVMAISRLPKRRSLL